MAKKTKIEFGSYVAIFIIAFVLTVGIWMSFGYEVSFINKILGFTSIGVFPVVLWAAANDKIPVRSDGVLVGIIVISFFLLFGLGISFLYGFWQSVL